MLKSLEPMQGRASEEVHALVKNSESQVIDALNKVIHSRVSDVNWLILPPFTSVQYSLRIIYMAFKILFIKDWCLLQTFVDNLGGSLSSAVSSTVQNTCREAYNKLLLPGLNAATQQIFSQVNESFSRGTRECESHFDLWVRLEAYWIRSTVFYYIILLILLLSLPSIFLTRYSYFLNSILQTFKTWKVKHREVVQ